MKKALLSLFIGFVFFNTSNLLGQGGIIGLNPPRLEANKFPSGLEIGQKAPPITALDNHADPIFLLNLLKKGPAVILFYGGRWDPVARKQIRDIQDSIKYITEKGAFLLAVTADSYEEIDRMVAETGATFPIIHDRSHLIMDAYKVSYRVSEDMIAKFKKLNINLKKNPDEEFYTLPVSCTYVVGRDRKVAAIWLNKNYELTAGVRYIINKLKELGMKKE